MIQDLIETKAYGTVVPRESPNQRRLYNHQKKAIENLNIIDENDHYSTLVILPTGGGKTYTASIWLLANALDKGKKILWLAHRQMLLEQAAESFQKYACHSVMPHISSFTYRIISGASSHDRMLDIKPDDQLLIISKDSAGRNLDRLDAWLEGENEVYLVIDEAHHSTAKTYRKVIQYVREKVPNVKLIGLTATPFRTAESEQGLLAKIYPDGVKDDCTVHGGMGISYQIGLKDLINRRILSRPIFESCYTDEEYGENLGIDAWESIEHFDKLPNDIAEQIATSAARNKLIVDTYLAKEEEYGQTIVFAVNVVHAITLCKLFNDAGVSCEYVVSDIKDMATGVTISREENQKKIEAFRAGKVQVLTNVNILTEGVDLPQTKTVFLARPTVSTILMTQMIGRALRGEAAGGTSSAYIVPFIDNWNEHIAWVNPESLYIDEDSEFTDNEKEYTRRFIHLIAISKIEEFASIINQQIDTDALEKIPFEKRIPVGMYAFHYLEEDDGVDISYQVMVYDSTKEAYENLMDGLSELFCSFGITEEYVDEEILEEMETQCRDTFFIGEMIPPYQAKDVIHILKYYACKGFPPKFYSFDEIDKSRLDVAKIAKKIWDDDMGARKRTSYLNELWENQDDNILNLFFGRKLYFLRQVEIEYEKFANPEIYKDDENVTYGKKKLESLPLREIGKYNPDLEKELRNNTFEKSRTKDGQYQCAECGFKSKSRVLFQVDHIVAMNHGGLSVPDNLQILCRSCNGRKGAQR